MVTLLGSYADMSMVCESVLYMISNMSLDLSATRLVYQFHIKN
jgi:hypothetical protein